MDNVVTLAVFGMFWGILCGIGPMVIAINRKQEALGFLSLAACAASGAVLGLLLAIPVALVLSAVAFMGKDGSNGR